MPATSHQSPRARRWPPIGDGPAPYFWASVHDGRVVALGDPVCELGRQLPERDAGVFARWTFDGEVLTAEVDAVGCFSLFVFHRGDTIGVSPSLLQLIAVGADTTLDRRAIGVFVRLGMFLHQDTPFARVHTLPPGGRLRWSRGTIAISGSAQVPRERRIDRRDAVDGFVSLARESLARILRCWPDDFVLPLSGGRDSRHILLEMHRQGRPPQTCVTFHHERRALDAEASAARAVCERIGVPHEVLARPRSRADDVLRALVLTSLCSDEHAQMMPLHDYFLDRRAAALDGIGGDILTNPDDFAAGHFELARHGDFRGMARRMMEGHASVISRSGEGAGPIYDADGEEEAVEYVAAAFAAFADAPDPYQAFWFWHRTRREIGFVPTTIVGTARSVFCPYLDPAFVDLGLSLPFDVTRDQRLHDDAIAKAFPVCRDVPFAEAFPGPGRRPRPWQRARQVLDGARAILAVRPDHPLREVFGYVAGSTGLRRKHDEVYRLYALCLERLDAAAARRLLALCADLRSARERDLVTSFWFPRSAGPAAEPNIERALTA